MLKNSLRFRLSFMAAVLVFGSATMALAPQSWWGRGIQGDCYNTQPKGASWLNWSGYSFGSWGWSRHYLNWYDGSNWARNGEGNTGYVYGGTNTALANSSAGYRAGNWAVSAAYGASFAAMTPRDLFYDFHC